MDIPYPEIKLKSLQYIIKTIKLLFLCVLIYACSNEKTYEKEINDELEKASFIDITNRKIIPGVTIPYKNLDVMFPKIDSFNYVIADNFFDHDTMYINKIEKHKKGEYSYDILKIKSDPFEILDQLELTSLLHNEHIYQTFLSPKKDQAVILYHLQNKNSIIKVVSYDDGKVLFEKEYSYKVKMFQNPWSENQEELVFSNKKGQVFILNIKKENLKEINCKAAENVMWLRPMNTIAYINLDKSIYTYNLQSDKNELFYTLDAKLFSNGQILDYYWFSKQSKFYVKSRYTSSVSDKIWKNKNFILEYADTIN